MQTKTVVLIILMACLVCGAIVLCGAFGLTGLLANWAGNLEIDGSTVRVGSQAPDFELLDINGQPHQLSEYQGQPVMLNFWALWCEPCKEEMPLLQNRFEELYPDLVILAIEDGSEIYNVRRYVNDEGLSFVILMGNSMVQELYHVYGFPTSLFIDAQGNIRAVQVGSLNQPELDEALAKIGLAD